MKCSEFHELAAAYALDALSEEERLSCARHLAHEGPHDGCEVLLARYERTVDALGESVPSVPVDASVWRAIEQRLATRSQRSDGGSEDGSAESAESERAASVSKLARIRPREVAAWALAAAALLGVVWTQQTKQSELAQHRQLERTLGSARAELTSRFEQSERARSECAEALAQLTERSALAPMALSLLEDPATKVTPMAQAGDRPARATALYNAESGRALVISSSLKPLPGKDYELWVIAGKEPPKPAGFVRFDASGIAIGEFDAALLRDKTAAALAVSLEPAGGRPTPTEVLLLAKLSG